MDATRFRILMVDDVSRYHMLYEMAITEALPATVHFATNGEEALEQLQANVSFDLLILDLNMPKLGGEETLKRIRLDPSHDSMPVIILTGDPDQETHRRLLDLGADDFVEKGSPPEIFVARLKAQMRHKVTFDRLSQIAVDMDIFAAGVLHDIRNLETTILTVCELTRAYLGDDPVAMRDQILEDFSALEAKADGLGRYAREIITMVRETRKPLDLKPLTLQPLIEWAVSMSSRELTIEIVTPLAPVIADKHFLQLALLNLVQNSVKYRRNDVAPHIVISQRPCNAAAAIGASPGVVTCLADNGVGIKPTELRKVFEPFVRGRDQASDKNASGFGLGLMLVSKVMSSMGGRVWAELPKNGLGTVMCLELPTTNPGINR